MSLSEIHRKPPPPPLPPTTQKRENRIDAWKIRVREILGFRLPSKGFYSFDFFAEKVASIMTAKIALNVENAFFVSNFRVGIRFSHQPISEIYRSKSTYTFEKCSGVPPHYSHQAP